MLYVPFSGIAVSLFALKHSLLRQRSNKRWISWIDDVFSFSKVIDQAFFCCVWTILISQFPLKVLYFVMYMERRRVSDPFKMIRLCDKMSNPSKTAGPR